MTFVPGTTAQNGLPLRPNPPADRGTPPTFASPDQPKRSTPTWGISAPDRSGLRGRSSEAHEKLEHAEHAQHAAGINKKIALLIAIMALFLAFSGMLGKSANTEAINLNILASDTWAFFQAKTIRRTTLSTAIEVMTMDALTASDAVKPAITKQIAEWQKTADRYRSEPETREGTAELMERAREAEQQRDTALARYHNYEVASAAFQIGIVMCAAAVVTATFWLAWVARRCGGRRRLHGARLVRPACAASRVKPAASACRPRAPLPSRLRRGRVAPRRQWGGAWLAPAAVSTSFMKSRLALAHTKHQTRRR